MNKQGVQFRQEYWLAVVNKKLSYYRDSACQQSLRCSRSFKITNVISNWKPVWNFLLVMNT